MLAVSKQNQPQMHTDDTINYSLKKKKKESVFEVICKVMMSQHLLVPGSQISGLINCLCCKLNYREMCLS